MFWALRILYRPERSPKRTKTLFHILEQCFSSLARLTCGAAQLFAVAGLSWELSEVWQRAWSPPNGRQYQPNPQL